MTLRNPSSVYLYTLHFFLDIKMFFMFVIILFCFTFRQRFDYSFFKRSKTLYFSVLNTPSFMTLSFRHRPKFASRMVQLVKKEDWK